MYLGAALILGLVGSLHCAGMCGPLMLAVPRLGPSALLATVGRLVYHLGRIAAYGLMGIIFGWLGQTVALAGFQRWASLAAGLAVLLALLPLARPRLGWPALAAVSFLKSSFGALLKRRTLASLSLLGLLNGFLPCGLVYVACAGALALGDLTAGVGYMLAFGLGTWPMMLGIGVLGRPVQRLLAYRPRLSMVCLVLVGGLLVLRGLSLGIPYLSPHLSHPSLRAPSCHTPQ